MIAADRLDYRLAAAREMRATHTVNVEEQDLVAAVEELTDGRMADLVFEAVGHQTETINQCIDLVMKGGTIVGFGGQVDAMYNSALPTFSAETSV